MKKLFTVIFLCAGLMLNAQEIFETYLESERDEHVFDALETESGYLCAGKSLDTSTANYNPYLIKLALDGEIAQSKTITMQGFSLEKGRLLELNKDTLVFYGLGTQTLGSTKFQYLFMMGTNADIDSLWAIALPLGYNYEILSYRAVVLNNGNIGFFNTQRPADTRKRTYLKLSEFTPKGQLIDERSDRVNHSAIIRSVIVNQDSLRPYEFMGTNIGYYVSRAISNANLQFQRVDEFESPVRDHFNVIKDGMMYYFSGYLHFTLDTKYQMQIAMLGNDFDSLKTVSFGKDSLVNDYPALNNSVSINAEKKLFFGATTNLVNPPGLLYNETWFMLRKTNGVLDEAWTRWYGGDAYYEMVNVLATSDGGCLMAGNRIDLESPNLKSNIYLLKVDGEGNAPGTDIPQIQEQTIVRVYPNPGTSSFSVNVKQPSAISISDMAGKTVKERILTQGDNVIDMKSCEAGIYLFKITNTNKNKVVARGKWIKSK